MMNPIEIIHNLFGHFSYNLRMQPIQKEKTAAPKGYLRSFEKSNLAP